MAGFVGLGAIGALVVNAINARTSTENLQVARQAQETAQRTALNTAAATRETLRLTERGELTERYAKAVELLGAEGNDMSVIGGIYALERLASDSPDDRPTIIEVLAAYVRQGAGLRHPQVAGAIYLTSDPDPELDLDERDTHPSDKDVTAPVRAAMSVLGRIASSPPAELHGFDAITGTKRIEFAEAVREGGAGADLREVNLRRLDLPGADLRRANFRGSDLAGANLAWADLRFAQFIGPTSPGLTWPGRGSWARTSPTHTSTEPTSPKRDSVRTSIRSRTS